MTSMKEFVLMRGVTGSGKTARARELLDHWSSSGKTFYRQATTNGIITPEFADQFEEDLNSFYGESVKENCLVVFDSNNPVYDHFLGGLLESARDAGYDCRIEESHMELWKTFKHQVHEVMTKNPAVCHPGELPEDILTGLSVDYGNLFARLSASVTDHLEVQHQIVTYLKGYYVI